MVWYERKQAAWDVQHELHQQRLVKRHELNTVLEKLRIGASELELIHRAQLERALEELETMEARINEDLGVFARERWS
eukprot:2848769-Rhodomonas_salina.1